MIPCRRAFRAIFIALAAVQLLGLAAHAEQLTLATYNILNYPGGTGASRAPHFRTVLEHCQPDILVVQEILGISGVNYFMNNVLEIMEPGLWTAGDFHDGYDTDRVIFIRDECVEITASGWLNTDLRSIDWWDLRVVATDDVFRVYTLHLKASQGSDNEQRRYAEALVLREDLDTLPPDAHFIVAGDFNIYYDDEPAWQLLRSAGPGQLFDPIEREGYWHNNPSFADIHTQSTRTTEFGGGAIGGMDDRFDFIISGDKLLDGDGLEILTDTYHAHGNDGDHFNTSIIDGPNGAVPQEVAEALHQASDHLPVLVDLLSDDPLSDVPASPVALDLSAWPNPFNPRTQLRFTLAEDGHAELTIYDLSGKVSERLLSERLTEGVHELSWRPNGLPSGLYLARVSLNGRPVASARLVLLK